MVVGCGNGMVVWSPESYLLASEPRRLLEGGSEVARLAPPDGCPVRGLR